ncbi:anti-sigma factor RsbA family regulatory protein [Actinokineospora cianjurensis]|uniref:Histidine kinase-like protein n=1 Tax=Actinokineospora cianjurensis TaxID=585224 RepID=A0A421AV75_9PSEU|nr:anti-sigma factor RsbA family regulatory protein [Actinokineospora cianjurensis]RLK53908.1 histidine kinase-like protein [Actinokineospora cianjurensis]
MNAPDHVALCYADDTELLGVGVPFLTDGLDCGDAVLLAIDPPRAELVLAAVDRPEKVTVISTDLQYVRPAIAIKSYRELFTRLVDGGAGAIRLLGEIPDPTPAWDAWSRYEATVNHAYDQFPLVSMCAYDTRTTPAAVLADVTKTHTLLARPGATHPNAAYIHPLTFLAARVPAPLYPVQHQPPAVALTNPTPSAARTAVTTRATGVLRPDDVDDLVVSVSEVVSNALTHGTAPITLHLWTTPGSVVVTVQDNGPGPTNPFAGLIPTPTPTGGGYGLWIAHQLCHHVALTQTPTTFTIRLTMGDPLS